MAGLRRGRDKRSAKSSSGAGASSTRMAADSNAVEAMDRSLAEVAERAIADVFFHARTWPPTPDFAALMPELAAPSARKETNVSITQNRDWQGKRRLSSQQSPDNRVIIPCLWDRGACSVVEMRTDTYFAAGNKFFYDSAEPDHSARCSGIPSTVRGQDERTHAREESAATRIRSTKGSEPCQNVGS